MNILQSRLRDKLTKRQEEGRLRQLQKERAGIDIYSNDYLGFATNKELNSRILNLFNSHAECIQGSTGSRLISGNSDYMMEVEGFIAAKHQVESSLLFPSGYLANQTLFSILPAKNDTIILDEKVHRSVYDGCRLSLSNRWKFRHNDLNHLEELLKKSNGQVWVGVDSLYSMDGDFAPLSEIAALCEKFAAALIVDEAHAIGTFGLGFVNLFGLQKQVFATLVTYGKAMGQSGAAVLGSKVLIDYLINYAPGFIYSTGMPDFQALCVQESYHFLDQNDLIVNKLQENIVRFSGAMGLSMGSSQSPIFPIRFKDVGIMEKALRDLTNNGFLSYGINTPTVPKGEEMIRVCVHSFNSEMEIDLLADILNSYLDE
jgi:8-amino-7-oxononanoate synthase